jgi:hypothetical protein
VHPHSSRKAVRWALFCLCVGCFAPYRAGYGCGREALMYLADKTTSQSPASNGVHGRSMTPGEGQGEFVIWAILNRQKNGDLAAPRRIHHAHLRP